MKSPRTTARLLPVLLAAGLISIEPESLNAGQSPVAESRTLPHTTLVYRCEDGFRFVANVPHGTESAWLFLPGETVQLEAVRTGSGAKYRNAEITWWSKGDQAMLELGAVTHRNCVNDRSAAVWEQAKLSGVDFRATGNEPGWHLEIRNGETITLVTDYGSQRSEFPAPVPAVDAEGRRTAYRTESGGQRAEVLLTPGPCTDTMSGEQFETRVEVSLDGTRLTGCGRALH